MPRLNMNLPKYPDFKIITSDDYRIISEFTSKFESYSDFNVLSLLSWNPDKTNAYSMLNGNLVIRVKDYLGTSYVYSILGIDAIDFSIARLIQDFKILHMVPHKVIEQVTNVDLTITEDPDSFDYILNTKNLASLVGSDYRNLRKKCNHFEKSNNRVEIRLLDLQNEVHAKAILELTATWCASKKFDPKETNKNIDSMSSFLNFAKLASLFSCGLYVEDLLVAFTLNELLPNSMAMGHFGKALNAYKYASEYIEVKTSSRLCDMGYKYINIQQDTGLQGLRATKLEFKPEYFLKKYTVMGS